MSEKIQSKQASKMLKRLALYQKVFASDEGQLVLQDLMATHHIMGPMFDPKEKDLLIFREGERNVVLRIMKILKMNIASVQKGINDYENS